MLFLPHLHNLPDTHSSDHRGPLYDPYCECIWQPYVKDEPSIADALLPETVV